ncbi:hypothetical protein [Lysobacter capsici]|uniref:hypothetical protein n=1 Tax=Lysobacter capsici TaxID=435897 RepID=UPI001C007F34|nr:hypothetical protein [Lysobacter capsici]QWF15998.1 hypothetical protein KME82_19840 [Lysobacter capsici]
MQPSSSSQWRGRGLRRSYREAMRLSPEVLQFIQRCEATHLREQQHTRRAAHMDVRRAPPRQDVSCGACLRLLRTRGLLIHKKAFFFGYLSFVALDKRK